MMTGVDIAAHNLNACFKTREKKTFEKSHISKLGKKLFCHYSAKQIICKIKFPYTFCNTNWLHNFYMMMGFLTSSLGESNRISIQNKNIIMETRQVGDK